jgi:Fur family transcriptional regulator, ferric uptake regulator
MERTERTWSERALAALSEAGFRSGGGRRQVVDLLGDEDCALTALEIDRRLHGVGRATVYRSLEQLEGLGLIQRVDVGGDAAGYERVEPSGHHHHPIVCEQCGRVVAFEDDGLEQAIVALAKRPDFTVSSHEVTLRGECESCGRASGRPA